MEASLYEPHCPVFHTGASIIGVSKLDLCQKPTSLVNTMYEAIHFFLNPKRRTHKYNMDKIGACRPIPRFSVSVSDLSPELLNKLSFLDKRDRTFVLKQAVGRIFEDINRKLYHNRISRVLEVRLVE